MSGERLRITEVFLSLQGESRSVGWPTVFVRLTGCPLRCRWCDTEYAFSGGQWMDLAEIVDRVVGYGVHHVCVTGGEPLAQKACTVLLRMLCDRRLEVSLETSGALDLAGVDSRVVKVMDLKAPGSGEVERNRWENVTLLTASDQVKFVIGDRADYEWAKGVMGDYGLAGRCEILFSPVQGEVHPRQLADWIVSDRIPVRFQLQLHKLLWGDEAGR